MNRRTTDQRPEFTAPAETDQDARPQPRTGRTDEAQAQEQPAARAAGAHDVDDHRTAQDRAANDGVAKDRVADHRVEKDSAAKESSAEDSAAKDSVAKDRGAEDRAGEDRAGDDRAGDDRAPSDRMTADHATAGRGTTGRPATGGPGEDLTTRVFEEQDAERFRQQWRELQAGFVDEPRTAVKEADALVAQMVQALTSRLEERKRALTGEWDRDGDSDTEALRQAMRRYRALVDQLLSV